VLVTLIDKCLYFDLLLAVKRRKPTKSAKARLVQKTIHKAQPRNNNELRKNGTTSLLPSHHRKRELFDQLRDLLSLVDKAFIDPDRPYFPYEVEENLLITLEDLQPYIGKKRSYRTPFWKCVCAVNHARPGMHLIQRLNRLVERARRLPSSPLEKLRVLRQQGRLIAHESGLVGQIEKTIGIHSNNPAPANVVGWAPVLKRVTSPECEIQVEALRKDASHIMSYPEVTNFIAFTRWLDFACQFSKWQERYSQALSSFWIVLVQLENENYNKQVFSDPVPDAESMKEDMAKSRAVHRQRRRRTSAEKQKHQSHAKNFS
jgi:hypothetical protein